MTLGSNPFSLGDGDLGEPVVGVRDIRVQSDGAIEAFFGFANVVVQELPAVIDQLLSWGKSPSPRSMKAFCCYRLEGARPLLLAPAAGT